MCVGISDPDDPRYACDCHLWTTPEGDKDCCAGSYDDSGSDGFDPDVLYDSRVDEDFNGA